MKDFFFAHAALCCLLLTAYYTLVEKEIEVVLEKSLQLAREMRTKFLKELTGKLDELLTTTAAEVEVDPETSTYVEKPVPVHKGEAFKNGIFDFLENNSKDALSLKIVVEAIAALRFWIHFRNVTILAFLAWEVLATAAFGVFVVKAVTFYSNIALLSMIPSIFLGAGFLLSTPRLYYLRAKISSLRTHHEG